MKKKLILIAVIVVAVAAFFIFDLNDYLSFETLKQSQAKFDTWFAESPWLISFAFFFFYVTVAALSLPGAAVMTLAAGALFGLVLGVIIVSFASTIGATLAFLVARFLLHDTVQAKFGSRLKAINDGVEKEGAFYLFTLRLVPAVPFFLINILMALTPIKVRTFYWVSQAGMLAGTAVYVNAGTQLAKISSPSEILSLQLFASFVLLGLFPLLAKKGLNYYKYKKRTNISVT